MTTVPPRTTNETDLSILRHNFAASVQEADILSMLYKKHYTVVQERNNTYSILGYNAALCTERPNDRSDGTSILYSTRKGFLICNNGIEQWIPARIR